MKMLSLFAGIGGIDLAAMFAGIETCAFVENNPFCQTVLAKNFPNIPIFGDIHDVTAESLECRGVDRPNIIVGGFPCQPVSLAGKRQAQTDDRWLWPEMRRLITEIRPDWVVGENVYGLVSKGLDDVLDDLESLNYTAWPLVFPACAVGAPHQRERIFIVAHSRSERQSSKWDRGDDGAFHTVSPCGTVAHTHGE